SACDERSQKLRHRGHGGHRRKALTRRTRRTRRNTTTIEPPSTPREADHTKSSHRGGRGGRGEEQQLHINRKTQREELIKYNKIIYLHPLRSQLALLSAWRSELLLKTCGHEPDQHHHRHLRHRLRRLRLS